MPEYKLFQLPVSLSALRDDELQYFIDDMRSRPTAWHHDRSAAVIQFGSQIIFEIERRQNNANPENIPREPRMLEFDAGELTPQQCALACTIFSKRGRDQNQPEGCGQVCDYVFDCMFELVCHFLAKAYPDGSTGQNGGN